MFVGAINQDLRSIISEITQHWKDREIFVGCSGNFTIERILNDNGCMNVKGNDVSLYTCLIGAHLTGQDFRLDIEDKSFSWAERFMTTGADRIAALMLIFEMCKFVGRIEPYHRRMMKAYTDGFERLHRDTVLKIEPVLEKMSLTDFYSGDVMDFIQMVPADGAFIAFPPTYKGGYETQYKKLEKLFSWDKPEYEIFDEEIFDLMIRRVTEKEKWVLSFDRIIPEIEQHLKCRVQTSGRSKPVYVYTNEKVNRLTGYRQRTEPVPAQVLEGDIEGPLTFARLTQAQMNTLRSLFLSPKIIPSGAMLNLAVLAKGKLIGACAFSASKYTMGEAYMMTDFAIRPTQYKRLSKLILAAVVSKEAKTLIEQSLGQRIMTIGTTAFTENAVSMKYRGLFEVYNRKENMVNYQANAGRWTLEEGLQWWTKQHGAVLNG